MTAVTQILKSKSDQTVHGIGPDAPVFDAVRLMAEKNIASLVVSASS